MVSRRSFLGALAAAAAAGSAARTAGQAAQGTAPAAGQGASGQGGLAQFMMSAPACTDKTRLTPASPDSAGFRPGAPERKAIVELIAGVPVVLTGGVAGLACGRIAGARVDFWQAVPKGEQDSSGFRYRGYQLTDANGGFQLITVMPVAEPGRAPHLGARIVVPGKATLTTELFFPDDPRNAKDRRFRPELLMQARTSPGGDRQFSFDFILDL